MARILAAVAARATLPTAALAHPGSGIVVDAQGQVFFQDSVGSAIWKFDTKGKLTVRKLGHNGKSSTLATIPEREPGRRTK
jgi:hypothetical protein